MATQPKLEATLQFSRPELHGPSALGLEKLVDFHLEHNPDYPFARLSPRQDQELTVTWRELSEAVHRAGHALHSSVGSFDDASPPVVGLLIPDDGLPYITIQLALIRIGLIVSCTLLLGIQFLIKHLQPLLIPDMNSTSDISHLLSATSCSFIVATENHDALSQKMAALRLLPEHQGIKIIPQPSINVLFPRLTSPGNPFVSDPKLQLLPPATIRPGWSTVMILTSSTGSSEFPKAIHLSRTAVQEWLCVPGDVSGSPVSGMTMSSMAWPSEGFVRLHLRF